MKQMIIAFSTLILLSACNREKPATYEIPKESSPSQPQQSAQSMAPMMGSQSDNELVQAAHATMSAQMPDADFSADLPEGWTENAGSGMRKASWTIGETSIDFYLIALSMGDVPSNVNRWRGQVGLPAATPEEIAEDVQTFQADGHEVNYIEIYNGESEKGIIAAIVDLSPSFWYFTAKGSVDELKSNAADIRTFLGSITFKGHSH
jgi:hypothetical protein